MTHLSFVKHKVQTKLQPLNKVGVQDFFSNSLCMCQISSYRCLLLSLYNWLIDSISVFFSSHRFTFLLPTPESQDCCWFCPFIKAPVRKFTLVLFGAPMWTKRYNYFFVNKEDKGLWNFLNDIFWDDSLSFWPIRILKRNAKILERGRAADLHFQPA